MDTKHKKQPYSKYVSMIIYVIVDKYQLIDSVESIKKMNNWFFFLLALTVHNETKCLSYSYSIVFTCSST